MIPNIHQSIEELLASASADFKIIWQQVRLLTGENAAVRQFSYIGPIVGSEFLTYSANKFYLASKLKFTYARGDSATTSGGNAQLHDHNNNLCFALSNSAMVWDSTGALIRYTAITVESENIPFSRVGDRYLFDYMQFTGFKFTR